LPLDALLLNSRPSFDLDSEYVPGKKSNVSKKSIANLCDASVGLQFDLIGCMGGRESA
jgi:hypothetical protein